jgi:PGF-CTERM protein
MPNLNDCTVEFSIPLTGGETDDGVMLTYTDHDADGLVSPGDELTLDWGDYDGDAEPEVYDAWASEYSAESRVSLEPLPGFGALLAVIGMLGAVLIRVESRNED